MMISTFNPFRLSLKPQWLARIIEYVLSLDTLARAYEKRPGQHAQRPGDNVDIFLDYTLQVLNAGLRIENADALTDIPRSGPVIMIANHPLGGLEGVAMSQQLRGIRPDLKVLTNELLAHIPEFEDLFIGVDVLSANAAEKNMRGMRQVMKHLKQGGALLIYPAGMVSAINTKNWRIEDRPWTNVIGKLSKQFKAAVVPFYVHGYNSRLFYLAGLIHPRLRTALLPRELARSAKLNASLTVGSPIAWDDMKDLQDADRITAYLRTATDLLSHHRADVSSTDVHSPLEARTRTQQQRQQLQSSLRHIEEYRLLQYRRFDVYCAPYDHLGPLMHEIAIARERTFRAAGEGTGLTSDSDRFDPHYLHLFIWDTEQEAIVGGYRVGQVDKIVDAFGVEGVYSRSLYQFDKHYVRRFGQALEVGRSFVSPEYQRHPRALDLLWQGIGNWVAQHPDYHTLFGCVSISKEHSLRARAFLNDSLMQSYRAEQEFLNDIRPVAPLVVRNRVWSEEVLRSLNSIVLINKLLGQCDPGKSIPVLLRQYLALNGKFIGFSVNHSFNDSLDGLIMVDLRKTPKKYLQRYLGKTGSEQFLKQWSQDSAAA